MSQNPSPVVLVVGASSGMGRAIAARLARCGARVVAAARRTDRLDTLTSELASEGHLIETYELDASRAVEVNRVVASVLETHSRIDTLVYATGTNIPQRSLELLSEDDWQLLLQTNLTGAFLCTKAVLPAMRKQQSGLIIYLSTGAVPYPDVSGVAYQASKHGLDGLSLGTRVEEKKNGVRTTVIYPGLCDTEILTKRPTPTPREIVDQALRPDDIADAVEFLCRLDSRCHVPTLELYPARV